MSDYDKQLKFIHGLQPWARKLIFRMPQLPDNLQDLMRIAERLGDDAMDKKEPGGEVKPAKVGKDNNSWQERKKRKKDKHVHEKFEPKPNNATKGGKSKPWETRKPPKDKVACFGCGKNGHMKKDCPKVVSASTPSERLKPLLGGGFVVKARELSEKCYMLVMRAGEVGDGVAEEVELVPKCVEDVLKRYQDVVPEDLPNKLPPRQEVDHKIEVKPGTEPPSKALYRLSQKELEELKSQLDELLAKGYIRQSKSPYGAPVLFVTSIEVKKTKQGLK